MSTSRSTWKARERDAAALFGAKRQPLSGSSGRPDQTRSDSTHATLFIECKLRARPSIWTLWESVAALAKVERKAPVVIVYAKSRAGGLVVVHQNDLKALVVEWLAAQDDSTLAAVERDVRLRRCPELAE